jgi:uncharacterized membrane protein
MVSSQKQWMAFRSRILLLAVLISSTFLSLGILAARRAISGQTAYHYMPFNLFLAWIPFGFALVMYWLHIRGSQRNGLLAALGILWLLFLPNAPYIWTDLVHVVMRRSSSVYWCDLVLGLTFGWNGMLLGLLSLQIVHRIARDRLDSARGWLIAIIALVLGSFSISVGRLERFNSWDVITRPLDLFAAIARIFLHPLQHSVHFAMAALFFAFLSLAYLMLLALLAAGQEDPKGGAFPSISPKSSMEPLSPQS